MKNPMINWCFLPVQNLARAPKMSSLDMEKLYKADENDPGWYPLFTLRTVEDTFRIKEYIRRKQPKTAVLAGGGFIGLELAENMRELGMEVTIIQRPKQLMHPFDADMASFIHNEMRKNGVKLALGHTVFGFEKRDGGVEVLLEDAKPIHADMVVLAIGVAPDTGLARDAGLELGMNGSIVVNDRMETSVPDIYAAGDAVQVKHYVTRRKCPHCTGRARQ